jgi:hypothetical protein
MDCAAQHCSAILVWFHRKALYFDAIDAVPFVSSIFSKDGFTGPSRKVWAFFLALYH